MCETNSIPEITNPLGRHWPQPDRSLIEFRDGAAYMPAEAFKALCDYSGSQPSGIYAGKMWKSYDGALNIWFLRWIETVVSDETKCSIFSRVISIIEEAEETEPVDDRLPVWML